MRYNTFAAFGFGLCAGLILNAPKAHAQNAAQQQAIAVVTVDIIAQAVCQNSPAPLRTELLSNADISVNDFTSSKGRFYPVGYAVMMSVIDRAKDHPKEFCASVGAHTAEYGR